MKVSFYEGLESEYDKSLHNNSIYKCTDTKNVYVFGSKQQSEYDKLCNKLIVGKAIPYNLRKGNRYYFRKRITIKSNDINAFKTGLVKDIESWNISNGVIMYKVNYNNGDDYSHSDINTVESYIINNPTNIVNVLCIIEIISPVAIQIQADGIISESGKVSRLLSFDPSDIRKQNVYIDQDGLVRTNSQKRIDKVTILKFRRCRILTNENNIYTYTNGGMKKYWKRCRNTKVDELSNSNELHVGDDLIHVPRNIVARIYYRKGHIKNPVCRVAIPMYGKSSII